MDVSIHPEPRYEVDRANLSAALVFIVKRLHAEIPGIQVNTIRLLHPGGVQPAQIPSLEISIEEISSRTAFRVYENVTPLPGRTLVEALYGSGFQSVRDTLIAALERHRGSKIANRKGGITADWAWKLATGRAAMVPHSKNWKRRRWAFEDALRQLLPENTTFTVDAAGYNLSWAYQPSPAIVVRFPADASLGLLSWHYAAPLEQHYPADVDMAKHLNRIVDEYYQRHAAARKCSDAKPGPTPPPPPGVSPPECSTRVLGPYPLGARPQPPAPEGTADGLRTYHP